MYSGTSKISSYFLALPSVAEILFSIEQIAGPYNKAIGIPLIPSVFVSNLGITAWHTFMYQRVVALFAGVLLYLEFPAYSGYQLRQADSFC